MAQADTESKILLMLKAAYPNLDAGPGTPFYEYVVRPMAFLWYQHGMGVDEYLTATNLTEYSRLPTEDLDRLLTRYFSYRKVGESVYATVRLILNNKQDTLIQAGEIFQANNLVYNAIADTFVNSYTLTGNDIDGYVLDVAVMSAAKGNAYNVYANQQVMYLGVNSANVRRAFFLDNGTDGGLVEDNEAYFVRTQDELSLRGLISYRSVRSFILERFSISEVRAIGLRDPELLRDLIYIPGLATEIHTGGKCDIYIRTSKMSMVDGYKAPLGFPYSYNNVDIVTNPDTLMLEWNNAGFTPQLPDETITRDKGEYLRGSVKEEINGLTPLSPMVSITSDIQAISDMCSETEYELLHTDNLVKQMWPLIVRVGVKISDLNAEASKIYAKDAVVKYINSLKTGDFPKVADLIHAIKTAGVSTVHMPIELECYYITEALKMEKIGINLVRDPDDSFLTPLEPDSLKFSIDDLSQMSLRTCIFYTEPDLVNVTIA